VVQGHLLIDADPLVQGVLYADRRITKIGINKIAATFQLPTIS
jgi:hypothetical protein